MLLMVRRYGLERNGLEKRFKIMLMIGLVIYQIFFQNLWTQQKGVP